MSLDFCIIFPIEKNSANNTNEGSNQSANQNQRPGLNITDESTLSRLVAARLDRPVSQRLLDTNFKLSVIKRCWEDQLRLKRKFCWFGHLIVYNHCYLSFICR